MAARIIEPATGASTWAFGSHKCKENIGIFTIKARMVAAHHIVDRLGVSHNGSVISMDELVEKIMRILRRRGSEAATV